LGPNEESWIGRQAKQTPDGGFVICGETTWTKTSPMPS